jgi:hypothetical protein
VFEKTTDTLYLLLFGEVTDIADGVATLLCKAKLTVHAYGWDIVASGVQIHERIAAMCLRDYPLNQMAGQTFAPMVWMCCQIFQHVMLPSFQHLLSEISQADSELYDEICVAALW